MEKLGERILMVRGKTPRAKFADLLGISSTALFNYEAGERTPSVELLLKICEETKINPAWLITGNGIMLNEDIDSLYWNIAELLINLFTNSMNIDIDEIKFPEILSDAHTVIHDVMKNGAASRFVNKEDLEYVRSLNRSQGLARFNGHTKEAKSSVVNFQQATGSNIIQSHGSIENVTIKNTTSKKNVNIVPPTGTIGANSFLIEQIQGKFNELGLRREERFGKSAYAVMYNEFKKHFSIPRNQKYTAYQLWPESRGAEIIQYLNEKLDNTIKGRKQKAAARTGHTKPYLLAETNELHKLLGWSGDQHRAHLHYLFGVTSRAKLNQMQLANYVAYLTELVDRGGDA